MPTVPWMFHRRIYHLEARKRLGRPAAFVFSKDSKEFHLFVFFLTIISPSSTITHCVAS
jgi:hypothetical protein